MTGDESGAKHQWHLLHLASIAVAWMVRLLPRRWRFRAAQLLAHAAEPFLRGTEAVRAQLRAKIDGPAEIALYLVTNALTVNGTLFDPILTIDGYDDFVRICREGRGVLLVQPHAVLTVLPYRLYHDRGLAPIGVSSEAQMRIAGTANPANPLVPSPAFLVTARNRLREGRVVSAMIDRGEHSDGRTVAIDTANGPVFVAPAFLQVAARCGARVAFTEVHVEGWRVVARIVVASSDTAEGLTREFGEFVRAHIAARFGGKAAPAAMPRRLEGAER